MKDLARLLIVALIGYGLYSYFLAGSGSSSSDESADFDSPARCVERLGDALDEFGSAYRDFGVPPIDIPAWEDRHDQLRQSADLAEAACQCKEEACRRGLEAAGPLIALISDLNEGLVSGTGPPGNGASRLDRIQRTYEAAKALR